MGARSLVHGCPGLGFWSPACAHAMPVPHHCMCEDMIVVVENNGKHSIYTPSRPCITPKWMHEACIIGLLGAWLPNVQDCSRRPVHHAWWEDRKDSGGGSAEKCKGTTNHHQQEGGRWSRWDAVGCRWMQWVGISIQSNFKQHQNKVPVMHTAVRQRRY